MEDCTDSIHSSANVRVPALLSLPRIAPTSSIYLLTVPALKTLQAEKGKMEGEDTRTSEEKLREKRK